MNYLLEIRNTEETLTAQLIADSPEKEKDVFAFYLYRNGIKEKTIWYSSKNIAVFDISKGGTFAVKAFIKKADNNIESLISENIPYKIKTYDSKKWGESCELTLDNFFKETQFNDGLLKIKIKEQEIDIYIDGIKNLTNQKGILVCFSGAVPKRSEKSAPFFSGINIAKKLNMPLIAISDTSLARSNQLALAWYAGNEDIPGLPNYIANILDHIGFTLKNKLILFGGSGGGFATLSIINEMNYENCCGAIWNPQTSITAYDEKAVSNYIKTCFPNKKQKSSQYSFLDEQNINHDLNNKYKKNLNKSKKVMYLQNKGDLLHFHQHALPFMESLGAEKKEEDVFLTSSGVCFWFGYWGEGHLVPSIQIITATLEGLAKNKELLELASDLKKTDK